PPRPLLSLGPLQPLLCSAGVMVRGPVAVLLPGRRVDHPCDVTGATKHELGGTSKDLCCRIGRLTRRDVILHGRKEVARCPDKRQVDLAASQAQPPRLD